MSNKYLVSERSLLAHRKLEQLSQNLIQGRSLKNFTTNEQIIEETVRILSSLYKDLNGPMFSPNTFLAGDLPDPNEYNTIFNNLLDDLTVIFTELEHIETLSVSNFNFASVSANRLFSRLKSVSSKLGDYILYAEDASALGIKFSDSFTNLKNIDTNSSLLAELQCDINQEEGIITLPINKDKTIRINVEQTPVIDQTNSNGIKGNNQQVNSTGLPVPKNDNPNVILDNNPDTWFEYERVDDEDTGQALHLEMTVDLGNPQIINRIVVAPNNFGTVTSITILDIKTSLDGRQDSEVSIKDDIPITGFRTDPNDDFFTLAPSTSKYAGKGIYTFTPRRARFVRFVFEQTDPYMIKTTEVVETTEEKEIVYSAPAADTVDSIPSTPTGSGGTGGRTASSTPTTAPPAPQDREAQVTTTVTIPVYTDVEVDKHRYAIGIRDINIYSLVFEPKGEVISQPFQSANDVRKAILDSSQNPAVESELASIQYFLSPNDGQNWYELQSRGFSGVSGIQSQVPEILNFNTVDEGAVETAAPVKTLRLKSLLSRNDSNFTEEKASSFQLATDLKTELHPIPINPPFSITLEERPIEGSVSVTQPFGGGASTGNQEYLGFEFQASAAGDQSYNIFGGVAQTPIIRRPPKKTADSSTPPIYSTGRAPISDYLHVYVAGEEWSHISQSFDSYSDDYGNTATSKVFRFDEITGVLSFGDGSNTASPAENSYIGIYFEPEKLFFEKIGDDYYSSLNFRTGLDKQAMKLKRYHPVAQHMETLPRGSREVHLTYNNLTSTTGIESALSGTKQTYLNGEIELTSAGDYSIDTTNGVVYLYTATPADSDTTVTYQHQLIEVLPDEAWDWSDDFSRFFIRGGFFETTERQELTINCQDNHTIIHLPDINITKDTLAFNLIDSSSLQPISSDLSPFENEVNFVDGHQEIYIAQQYPELVTEGLIIAQKVNTGVQTQIGYNPTLLDTFIIRFDLGFPMSTDDDYQDISFSFAGNELNGAYEIFDHPKSSYDSLVSYGDYYIDRSGGSVYCHVGPYQSWFPIGGRAGSVTYYQSVGDTEVSTGEYSVDYANGIIYLQRVMSSNWLLNVSYEISDYRATYKIARQVPDSLITISTVDPKTITLNSDEILNRYSQPEYRANLYYQINYKYKTKSRTDIPALKDYFTPVIKDYSLRMITDRDLF